MTIKVYSSQQGAVLVVSLVMLMILTLIGLNSMQTTQIEEKMSYNMRDRGSSFQSVEAAVLVAEAEINAWTALSSCTNASYCYLSGTNMTTLIGTAITWTTTASQSVVLTNVENPRYVIQNTGNDGSGIYFFTIYAQGTGASGQAQTMLKSYYNKALTP